MKHFTKYSFLLFIFLLGSLCSLAQKADFIADVVSGCDPLVVSFTDKSTGAITSWNWDFGDSKTSVLPSPSTSYTVGTYTAKLTVRNGSGTPSTKTITITVYPSPKVSFTSSAKSICPCTEVTFTNTSVPNSPGAYTSIWSFGDGYTATTNNSTHSFCTPATYNVALKVTNSIGCSAAKVDTATVTVTEKPEVNFIASKTKLCKIPDTANFTNYAGKGKAPYTFKWEFGDGGTSLLPTPGHAYTTAGTYTVRLIITDANGCKDTAEKVNYITAGPMNSDFSVPSSICAGVSQVRFDNASSPKPEETKWLWSDGGGATGPFAQRDFWKGGTYTVTMIDSFGPGCKDTAVHTYTVNPKPHPNFSYSPIYPCPAPASITFVNKTSDADSFLWIFGDRTTSTTKSPVHTYMFDSVFTVYLIAKTSFGCLDTFRVRDTNVAFPGGYAKIRYDSSNSPVIVRVYNAKIDFSLSNTAGCIPLSVAMGASIWTTTHLPSVVDTSTPFPACGVIRNYKPPYWYCTDLPRPDPYPDEYHDSITWAGPEPFRILYPYKPVSYYWEFGDGATSTAANPTHVYTTEGHFTIKCTIKTENGCSITDTTWIEAGEKPHADFSFTPAEICKNDYVYFTNLSTHGLKYTWDWTDGFITIDTVRVLNHQFKVGANRRITLTAERYGCIDTISKLLIINPPSSAFGMKYSCDTPLKVRFLDSSYRATKVRWLFGDGDTSTLRNPVHFYADTGTYVVKLITTNDSFSCIDTAERIVNLYYVSPTFTSPNVCLGDTSFLYNTNPNFIRGFKWKTVVPVEVDSATLLFYARFKDTGTILVTMISEDTHNCLDTFSRYITVAKPQMKVKASPVIACAPATINFTDSSSNTKGIRNVRRTWYWGDATSFTDTSIYATKLFSTPGTYKIKVVTTDALGCKDSTTISIESSKPVADFTADVDTFACIGKNINFGSFSTGSALTCTWDFGDGSTASGDRVSHSYSSTGIYNIKLVVTDKVGCKDSMTKISFIKIVKPKADFTMSDSVTLCPPMFISFTNTSSNGAIRYRWDFDNGSFSDASNPVAPYLDSGIYIIQLVATDKYGCTDTAYKRARLLGYDGLLKYAPLSGCAPHEVSFEAEPINAEVMVWDFADGITESAVGKLKTKHIYAVPGAYVPRLILGDGKGCSTSSKGLDTIKVDGTVAFVSHTPACINTPVTFNDSSFSYFSTHASSEWTFEDGTTATGKNPVRTYTKTGIYTVTLITTNTNGCKDTIQTSIVVLPLPVITAIDTVICLGDQAALKATGGVSYTWDPSPTLSCSDCNSPLTNTKVPARYFVTGTDKNGCSNRDTLDVGIKTKTTLILAEDAEICELTPIQLNASGAQTYAWSPATFLSDPNIANPVATMENTVVYRVIGTEGSCIPDTGFIKVTVHPLPDVSAGPDQKVLAGTEVQLSGSGTNIKDYRWTPAATLSCDDCTAPTAKPLFTTTYTLKGTSEFGCSDSDDVVITIFCDQSQLFIPNTFTPNGDGQNDYFYPQGKGVAKIKSFIIFNRWGQKVYQRTNIDANIREQGWDGSFNGEALNPDTFVYTLEAACDNGELVFWKGDVTLIK